ncbi:hypothetical protein BKA62DRAFT_690488 [Auriculariales sp. MPI-PUGE-AT-0066]|nr:hypothetical protein BKA62DRAFT_690488 [Auriculariales sp. MPI-PUGE-AT-0066]
MASSAVDAPPAEKAKLFPLFYKKGDASVTPAQTDDDKAIPAPSVPKRRARSAAKRLVKDGSTSGQTQLQLGKPSLTRASSSSTPTSALLASPSSVDGVVDPTVQDLPSHQDAIPDLSQHQHILPVAAAQLNASNENDSTPNDAPPATSGETLLASSVSIDRPTNDIASNSFPSELQGSVAPKPSQTARKNAATAGPARHGSQQRPIQVLDSPSPPPHPRQSTTSSQAGRAVSTAHTFFLRRPHIAASRLHVRDMDQATPDSRSQRSSLVFRARSPASSIETAFPRQFLRSTQQRRPLTPTPENLRLNGTLLESISHPALEYVASRPVPTDSTWCEHYKPTKSEQILGNNQHANTLKSWLKTHQLRIESQVPGSPFQKQISTARPTKRQVIRTVVSKRKRRRIAIDSEDDWLASDDAEEQGDDAGADDDDYGPLPQTHVASEYSGGNGIFPRLTNLIILEGPNGIGKSATAHACASELGWSVFEIHPGIGKRSGANILSLVGDAASNHVLRLGKEPDYFALDLSDSPLTGGTTTHAVQQSLFLFDEADILFRDDVGFWPALIDLVANSRRPVILTCNDISLLPINDLPVQTVLHFQPIETSLACALLQGIAKANGTTLDDPATLRLYERRDPTLGSLDGDLRHAITALQLLSNSTPSNSFQFEQYDGIAIDWAEIAQDDSVDVSTNEKLNLLALERATSAASFCDQVTSYIQTVAREATSLDDSTQSIGHTHMCASDWEDSLNQSGSMGRLHEIGMEAASYGLRLLGSSSTPPEPSLLPLSAFRGLGHIGDIDAFMELVPLQLARSSRQDVVLDFVPAVLSIVRADDILQKAHSDAEAESSIGGRMTRRRRHLAYERYVESESVISAARALAVGDGP